MRIELIPPVIYIGTQLKLRELHPSDFESTASLRFKNSNINVGLEGVLRLV